MLIHLLLNSLTKNELERYFTLKEIMKENKEVEGHHRASNAKKSMLKNIVSKIKDGKTGYFFILFDSVFISKN